MHGKHARSDGSREDSQAMYRISDGCMPFSDDIPFLYDHVRHLHIARRLPGTVTVSRRAIRFLAQAAKFETSALFADEGRVEFPSSLQYTAKIVRQWISK